jgi:hypothetical protein
MFFFWQITGFSIINAYIFYGKGIAKSTEGIIQIIFSIFENGMQLYLITSLVLFNVLTYASTLLFRTAHNQIKQHNNNDSETLSDTEIYILLQKTKRLHKWGFNTASITNGCFGWALLLATSFIFFGFINMSFYMYNDIVDGSPPSEILIDILFLERHSIISYLYSRRLFTFSGTVQ